MSPVTSPPPKKKNTHPSIIHVVILPQVSRRNSESKMVPHQPHQPSQFGIFVFQKKNRQYPTISSKYFLKPLWIVSWKTESNGSLIKSILKSKVTALQLNTPMFTHQKFQPFRGEKKIQPSNPILHATMDLKIQWTEYSAKTIWKGQP